ncbi:MAG: PQQ-dependent sugar dehydrogenase [Acidobacteria bacterium]|nr:PQQ-dependent sugar dehydrogenase [Acidobacteriota bacterium]
MKQLSAFVVLAALAAFAQKSSYKLPEPFHTPSAANGAKVVPQPQNMKLKLPARFSAEEYASGFQKPRYMVQGPSGELLVTESVAKGAVTLLTNGGKDRKKLIENIDRPYGLAFWKDYLYVAEPTSLKRYKYDAKAMSVGAGEEIVSMKDFGKGHWTRSITFDRKGEKFYLGVGSSGDLVVGDPETRAAITRYNADGSGMEVIAGGMRNPVGMKVYPGTDTLWAAVQERDFIGDDLVPDYFTSVRQGAFYGWPFAYIGPHEDPRNKGKRPDLVDKTVEPDMVLQPAHVAVLDFTFYTGKMFPAHYRGGAFLAFHGSSNRAARVGYSIAFVPFKNGKPAGQATDFLTGWMISPDVKEVWGRPVAVLEMKDGSLLVSDDGGNKLWRVSYK